MFTFKLINVMIVMENRFSPYFRYILNSKIICVAKNLIYAD